MLHFCPLLATYTYSTVVALLGYVEIREAIKIFDFARDGFT